MIKLSIFGWLVLSILWCQGNPILDKIKKAGGAEKYPGSGTVIIFDSISVNVKESGLSYVITHNLQKILTEKAANALNVLKIDYDPLSAFIEFREIKIYRKTGQIDNVSLEKVLDFPAPARMIYWGARQKMVELGHLEVGDAIEVTTFRKGFTYALLTQSSDDERYIPPMKGHFYDIVEFWNDNFILSKIYKVSMPKSKTLQYKFFNGTPQIVQSSTDSIQTFCFTLNNIEKIQREDHMVALSDVGPKLLLSTSPDWESKARWFYKVNEDYGSFNSTTEINKKVKEILKDAKSELDSITRLTQWSADEIRYSGLSMGEGEGYTLHKGEMNFCDRCGVCKDKAGMLVTMLRAAGFESYAAMTMAGSRIEDIPADQFNHSVTVVKLRNGEYKMLDPTWVPFTRELWSSREQQQNYLMGLPDGADLMEIPISSPDNHYIKINIKSELHTNGTLKAKIFLEAEGQSDAAIRSIFTYSLKEQWENNLIYQLGKIHPMVQIDSLHFTDPYAYRETPVQIIAMISIPNYAINTAKSSIFVPLSMKNLFDYAQSHLFFDTSLVARKYAFVDRCSRLVEISETLQLPDGTTISNIPETINFIGKAASFSFESKQEKETLTISEKIRLEKRVYTTQDWPDFKTAVSNQIKLAKHFVLVHYKN